jgi:hypothetical protein
MARRTENTVRHSAGPTCDACLTVSVSGAPLAMSTVNYAGFEMVLCNDPLACRLRAQRKNMWKVYEPQ